MDELIQNFHIDWHLLTAQIINFVIVIAVLWFFALKPLVKKMNERTKYVEKSLTDAKQVEENLAKVEEMQKEKMADATREAERIIKDAKKRIEDQKQLSLDKTKKETAKIIVEAKEQINIEKEKTTKEIKKNISELIVVAMEKILGESIDSVTQEKLVKKTIEAIKK